MIKPKIVWLRIIAGLSAMVFIFFLCAPRTILCAEKSTLPHEQEIKTFLNSLFYTSLDNLEKKEAFISLNFKENAWTIHNVFRYEADGNIANAQSKRGVCMELSQITYDHVYPLLSKDYKITFVLVTEPTFFKYSSGLHFILKLSPRHGPASQSGVLFLDPTYKIYDYAQKLSGYKIINEVSKLDIFAKRTKDIGLPVDCHYPIMFSKNGNILFGLTIKKVYNKFDQDNYAIVVAAMEPFSLSGKILIMVIKSNGKLSYSNNNDLLYEFLDRREADKLRRVVLTLFTKVTY